LELPLQTRTPRAPPPCERRWSVLRVPVGAPGWCRSGRPGGARVCPLGSVGSRGAFWDVRGPFALSLVRRTRVDPGRGSLPAGSPSARPEPSQCPRPPAADGACPHLPAILRQATRPQCPHRLRPGPGCWHGASCIYFNAVAPDTGRLWPAFWVPLPVALVVLACCGWRGTARAPRPTHRAGCRSALIARLEPWC